MEGVTDIHSPTIGKTTRIHGFVYIEDVVTIGERCIIKPFVFIPDGVTIEDDVFIGPSVTFTNDKYPRVGRDWKMLKTLVKKGASIGAGSTICPGVTIGEGAVIGAGSVIVKDVAPNTTVTGIWK